MEERQLDKPILIALIGKSASGKTYLMNELLSDSFKYEITPLISSTTRPPREGEVDGKDYFFLSTEQFLERRKQNCFLEWTMFRNWYYGHEKIDVNTDFIVGIFDPAGIRNIIVNHKKEFSDVIVVYMDTNFPTRVARMIQRESGFKVEFLRRIIADFWDFRDMSNFLFKQKCWILNLQDYQTQFEKLRRIEVMCSTVLNHRVRLNNINDYTKAWNGRDITKLIEENRY